MTKEEHGLDAKLRVGRIFPEYDPVVDGLEGKYTAISLVEYYHSTGLIMRSARSGRKLLAYCVQDPKEVFEGLYKRFAITRFQGRELYSSNDFEKETPMVGLSICAMKPVMGINGDWYSSELAGIFDEVIRKDSVSSEHVQRIIDNVSGYGMTIDGEFLDKMSSQFEQNQFDEKQFVDLLMPFLQNS